MGTKCLPKGDQEMSKENCQLTCSTITSCIGVEYQNTSRNCFLLFDSKNDDFMDTSRKYCHFDMKDNSSGIHISSGTGNINGADNALIFEYATTCYAPTVLGSVDTIYNDPKDMVKLEINIPFEEIFTLQNKDKLISRSTNYLNDMGFTMAQFLDILFPSEKKDNNISMSLIIAVAREDAKMILNQIQNDYYVDYIKFGKLLMHD